MPLIWRNKTIVLLVFVQGDGKMVPSSSQGHRPKPSAKVLRKAPKAAKRAKVVPQWVAVAASCNNDNKEVDGSDVEYFAAVERDSKRLAW
jgi:hypothetical protein